MKVLKLVLSILLWIVMVALAIIGIRYLIIGGWKEFGEKLAENNNNFWEFIKWFFSSMWNR